jgi:hypothetical protein
MLVRTAMTTLGPPPLGVKARDAKRRQSGCAFQEALILSPPKDLGDARARAVINRLPPPPLLALAAHKASHFLPLGCVPLVDDALSRLRINPLEKPCMDVLSC